jgi:hypothetical protein
MVIRRLQIFQTKHFVNLFLAQNQMVILEYPWYSTDLVLYDIFVCKTKAVFERDWFLTIEEIQKNVKKYWKGNWKITSSNISWYSSGTGMCEGDDIPWGLMTNLTAEYST